MTNEENTNQVQADAYNMEQRLVLLSERFHTNNWLSHSALVADAGLMIHDLAKELASVRADRDERAVQKGHLLNEISVMQRQRNELLEGIRYWSYCTSEGMRETAPEKCGELAGFLMGCKIAPYYMPKE